MARAHFVGSAAALVAGGVAIGAMTAHCAHPGDVIVPFPAESSSADAAASAAPVAWDKLGATAWQALPARTPAPPTFVWWEGENPSSTDFPARHSFMPEDDKQAAILSGGKWLGSDNPGKALFAEYSIVVPKDAAWNLYVRKFWKHGPFRWRFDAMPWTDCGRDVALLDEVGMRKFVVANWVNLGKVQLTAGKHAFRIELTDPKGAAAFDAFLLIDGPFTPRGKLQPGEKYNRAPDGWFAFEPDLDDFESSAIDWRSLNETSSGEHGFIQVRGDSFVHEKGGAPLVFWAVNSGHDLLYLSDADIDYYARHLAKAGVNMVRLHGDFWRPDALETVDPKQLERLHYLVAALKKQGVYLELSIFFPLWLELGDKQGYKGYGNKHPFALPFFDDRFQRIMMGWWKQLLTSKNPHTGLALVDDPTVALAELINEDGTLFWTFNYDNVPDPAMQAFEKQFGDFLRARYGSIKAALDKWARGAVHKRDAPAQGRVGFMPLWEIFNKKDQRARDTAEFLTRTERAFYDKLNRYLKKDLGFKGATVCSNWITADATILGPLDKYANSICDVMDHHGYYGGPHEGDAAGWSVAKGQKYDDASALRFESAKKHEKDQPKNDFSLPIMDPSYDGKPSINSEINWPPPNRYRADLPMVAAAYGVLQGSDGPYFFATAQPAWDQQIGKFSISDPAVMGQFPALAPVFRRGLVKRGEPVARIQLTIGDLYALKGAPASAPVNLDLFRKSDVPAGKSLQTPRVDAIDPLAYLVGPVELGFTETAKPSSITNLASFVDRRAMVVRSDTGELFWDWNKGLMTVNAPRFQGATGFLAKAGALDLADVRIDVPLEYGAVAVVALDDKPLSTSDRILVQVFSEESNFGWKASQATPLRTIEDAGSPPIVVKKLSGGILFKRPDTSALHAEALDPNGYPTSRTGDLAQGLPLLPQAIYYVVQK